MAGNDISVVNDKTGRDGARNTNLLLDTAVASRLRLKSLLEEERGLIGNQPYIRQTQTSRRMRASHATFFNSHIPICVSTKLQRSPSEPGNGCVLKDTTRDWVLAKSGLVRPTLVTLSPVCTSSSLGDS
jgi:hypothetical protein